MSVIIITYGFLFEGLWMIIKMIIFAIIWELAKPRLAKGLNFYDSMQRQLFGGLLIGWMGSIVYLKQSYRRLESPRVTNLQVFYQKW